MSFQFPSVVLTYRFLITIVALASFTCTASAQTADAERMLRSSRNAVGTKVEWTLARVYDFDNPSQLSEFNVIAGKFEIRDGALRAIEGRSDRAIILSRNEYGNYVRIEMEVTNFANELTGRTGDISFLLNAIPHDKYEVFFYNGYSLTTASFGNSSTTFYKKGKPIARTEYTPVISGKKNLAVLEYMNGHIRYWLNDEIILEGWDYQPLQMNPQEWIAVRSYDTLMVIDKLTISTGKPL